MACQRALKSQSETENRACNLLPFNPSGPSHSLWSRLVTKYFLTATLFLKIFCNYFAEFRINASLHLVELWIPSVAISPRLFYVHLWNNLTTNSISQFHVHMIPDSFFPCLLAQRLQSEDKHRADFKHKPIYFPWSLFPVIWWMHSLSFLPGLFLHRNVYRLNNNTPQQQTWEVGWGAKCLTQAFPQIWEMNLESSVIL